MTTEQPLPMLIKANRDGFTLVPALGASFGDIMAFMRRRLDESHDFFLRSEMRLDLRGLCLTTAEIQEFRAMLADKAEVKLVEVQLGDDFSLLLDRPTRAAAEPRERGSAPAAAPCPLVIRSTCRSGTRVESLSDCVIVGDVNPGAEVIAVGDVLVFGNLRGIAHAGANGDSSARIWALSIEPHQIRIADLVAVPPRGRKPMPKRYEVALIQGSLIQVLTM